MLRKEMTKVEIERELQGKGDYVLIDNITRFLKENLPMDMKKFLYLKLTDIYQRRNMFPDAAEIFNKLTEISLNPADRVNHLMKETECFIKAGFFDRADLAMRRVVGEVNSKEGKKITDSIKEFYKNQAKIYEKEKRRNKAAQTYEKILTMNLLVPERDEINKKLLGLYKELGMIEQYMAMKKKTG